MNGAGRGRGRPKPTAGSTSSATPGGIGNPAVMPTAGSTSSATPGGIGNPAVMPTPASTSSATPGGIGNPAVMPIPASTSSATPGGIGNPAVSSSATSTSSVGTSSTRHVLEAAAATVKEFVPRGSSGNTAVAQPSIPASAIHAQEFVPQGASTSFNVVYGPGEGVGGPNVEYSMYGPGPPDQLAAPEPEANYQDVYMSENELQAFGHVQQVVHQLLYAPSELEIEFSELADTLNQWIVTEDAVQSICQFLVSTGVNYSEFSYIGGRLIHLLDATLRKEGALAKFRNIFLKTLNLFFDMELPGIIGNPATHTEWLNFSMFFAEVYRNVVINSQEGLPAVPLKALSVPLLEIIRKLLMFPDEGTVQCACNILKLTGSYLKFDAGDLLSSLIEGLRVLPHTDVNLSRATGNQIVSVLKLADSNWGISDSRSLPSPIFVPSTSVYAAQPDSQPYMTYPDSGHAAAAGGAYSQEASVDAVSQAMAASSLQPVSNPDMWSEYAGPEDEDIDEEDLALQRDMEEEYARFLRETDDS